MVNLPVAGFDETQQQRRQGGFSRPAGADQGDVFPGMDFQREILQGRFGFAGIGIGESA